MFSPLTTDVSGNANQFSRRTGNIDRIILHHCASTSLSAVLGMMGTGSREVSANYVIGNKGEIVGVVPEEYRAWTSGSAAWDGRAITFEIVNETAAPEWRISSKAFDAVARMLADISARYGIELSRSTVVTHQELYTIHGSSYATACPGPYLQARINDLIMLAKKYLTAPTVVQKRRGRKMLGLMIVDGEGRYGKKGERYFATYDGGNFVQLSSDDANAVSVHLDAAFANVTYAGWEAYQKAAQA